MGGEMFFKGAFLGATFVAIVALLVVKIQFSGQEIYTPAQFNTELPILIGVAVTLVLIGGLWVVDRRKR